MAVTSRPSAARSAADGPPGGLRPPRGAGGAAREAGAPADGRLLLALSRPCAAALGAALLVCAASWVHFGLGAGVPEGPRRVLGMGGRGSARCAAAPAITLPPEVQLPPPLFGYDAVWTYHNRETSPSVRRAYQEALEQHAGGIVRNRPQAAGKEDADMDLFTLSIALARKYLRGLRKIHVIVDYEDEVPAEIKAMRDVHIVLSKDIYPSTTLDRWPYFSAYTKEDYMQRIPGLTEAFVFLNDDMLITRPVERTQFFTEDGDVRWLTGYEAKDESWGHFFRGLLKGAQGGPTSRRYTYRAACGGCGACERELEHDKYYPSHAPRPFLKSYLAEMERRHPEAFLSVFSTRFRCKDCLTTVPLMLVPASGYLDIEMPGAVGGSATVEEGAESLQGPRSVRVVTEPAKKHALLGYFNGVDGVKDFEHKWAQYPFVTVQEASAENHAGIEAYIRSRLAERQPER